MGKCGSRARTYRVQRRPVWLGLCLLLPCLAAGAEEWSLSIRSMRMAEVQITQLSARLRMDEQGSVRIDQGRSALRVGDRQLPAQRWQLSYAAASEGASGGDLAVTLAGGPTMRGSWARDGNGRIDVALLDRTLRAQILDPQHWTAQARALQLGPWRTLLGDALGWTPSTLEGQLDAQLDADFQASGRVSKLAFDSADGLNAAAGVAADFDLQLAPTMRLRGRFEQGELLVNPAYLQIPPSGLAVEASRVPQGWQLQASQDGAFSASIDWPDQETASWRLQTQISDLHEVQQRYLESVWSAQALPPLTASGTLELEVSGRQSQLQQLSYRLQADQLAISTLSAQQVSSQARWQDSGSGQFELAWQALKAGEIDIASAQLAARQEDGLWSASEPLMLRLLAGQMQLSTLTLDQRRSPWQASAGLSVQSLDLATLCRALGWVEMPGKINATFPQVSVSAERMSLSGGAQIEAFGGQIALGALEIERPLGVAPAIQASASFAGLDLGEVTSVFDFGEITGKMNGEIKDLRVLGGKPVAFEAQLRTDPSYRGKRQISQRAVNNLSSVGGAGGGALSRSVLRVFDRFGYDAIGIGCRLSNGICTMSGLEQENGGFLIVRGSGLPRITVMGHAQRVDWDTLVARLIAATAGAAPTIE